MPPSAASLEQSRLCRSSSLLLLEYGGEGLCDPLPLIQIDQTSISEVVDLEEKWHSPHAELPAVLLRGRHISTPSLDFVSAEEVGGRLSSHYLAACCPIGISPEKPRSLASIAHELTAV